MFGEKLMGYSSPLEKGNHPELDMSPELNEEGHALYMSLVGQSQWLILLGCFDLACAIMTMSHFRAALREGHMKCQCKCNCASAKIENGVRATVRVLSMHTQPGECREKEPKAHATV